MSEVNPLDVVEETPFDKIIESQTETGEPDPVEPEKVEVVPPTETPDDHKRKGQEAALLAERRKRQDLERELDTLRKQQPPKAEEPKQEAPDPAKFDDYGAYLRAQARWEAKQVIDEERQRYTQAQETRLREAEQDRLMRVTQDRISAGQAKYQDFDAVVNDGLAPFLNPIMHAALVDSDVGHDVAYYLGKNPAEAERIANLHPTSAVREIGKLEAKLQQPPQTTPSNAPPPITPVGQRAKANKGPGEMTDLEYAKWRAKGRK